MRAGLSLKEIQVRLGVPQHVLIHLCEKGVVKPGILPGVGRGKFRLFSERNLFEFAVALELRKYELSVRTVAVLVGLIAHIELAGKQLTKGAFSMPESLLDGPGKVMLYLFDGNLLVFSLGTGRMPCIDIAPILGGKARQVAVRHLTKLPKAYTSCLSLNLAAVAKATRLLTK